MSSFQVTACDPSSLRTMEMQSSTGQTRKQSAQPTLMLATLGRAPVVAELKQRLERVKGLRTPLLLTSEPGSGVEACARFVHAPSERGVVRVEALDTRYWADRFVGARRVG